MLVSDRFMASAISLVWMVPAAPTIAPATTSALLPITRPAMATAVPVHALSSEMTTGMSAPPMGSTIVTPKPSAASASTAIVVVPPTPATSRPPATAAVAASTVVVARAPGNWIGRPGTMPCSLPEATSEPVNVTAPISTSSAVGTPSRVGNCPPGAAASACTATSAAAPPPTALKRLTSCGMAVIRTVCAAYSPASAPTVMPPARLSSAAGVAVPASRSSTSVAARAAAMPVAETRLPSRAVRGAFMRCRPATKATAAAR